MQTNTDKLIATKENGIGWIIFNNPARHNAVDHVSVCSNDSESFDLVKE